MCGVFIFVEMVPGENISYYICEKGGKRMDLQLKAIRSNADLSLEKMAAAIGVSKTSVWRWEHKISAIPEEAFKRYCEICGADQPTIEALRKNLKIKERISEHDTRK